MSLSNTFSFVAHLPRFQDQVTVASYDLPLEKTPDASAKHEQKNAGDA